MTAGGLGIEPRYWASKAHVLPLDDPPMFMFNLTFVLYHSAGKSSRTASSIGSAGIGA